MHDADVVRGRKRVDQLPCHAHGLRERQGSGGDALGQGSAAAVRHHEVGAAIVGDPCVEELRHVPMHEP